MRRTTSRSLIAASTVISIALAAAPVHATYPGKNGPIAISMDRGDGTQIFTIEADGTDLRQLTSVDGSALDPDWSPDGTKIVFDLDPSGESPMGGCRVQIMDADGTDVVDLTPARVIERGCAYDPSFTPNGRRIVFMVQRCGRCWLTISSMKLDGTDRRRIARSPGYGLHSPDVSPDGKTILFVAEKDKVVQGVEGNRKALFTVRRNGTHMRKIVPFQFDVCVCGGDWAPNGKRIVSSDQVGPTPVPGQPSNIFTVRPDGSRMRYLTHNRTPLPDVLIGVGTYSPDGRWIDFKRVVFSKEKYLLLKIRPDGSHLTRIRRLRFNFTGRDWGSRP